MKLTRRALLAGCSAAALAVTGALDVRAQQTSRTKITFVLINDFYSMSERLFPDGHERGGFARLAAVIKAERAKGGHVIVAHAGDTLSPSLMSSFDQGEHIVALSNLLGIDIFAPGNHEFDFGKAVFLKRMQEANFPLYAANLRDAQGARLPGFKDREVLSFDGVRVGLMGLAYDNSPRLASPEDLQFRETVSTAKAQAATLRQEGADFIAVVMHAERGDSLALQAARTADLFLTGHTHELYLNFDGQTTIVESGYDAYYVTAVDFDIIVTQGAEGRTTTAWPQFRVIDTAHVTPDPAVAAAVARYQAEFAREMDVAIGTTSVELDSRNATVRTREAAIGNLVADAMRAQTHSEAALINGGGIRAGKVYRPGDPITRRDILAELPFGNRVVVVEISGKELRLALEHGLSALPEAAGRFPQVSGIQATYDPSRPVGARVTAVRVNDAPLQDGRTYRVAIIDFLARGGDDYRMLQGARRVTPDNDAPLLANEVMTYVRRLGTVRTGVEGRLSAS